MTTAWMVMSAAYWYQHRVKTLTHFAGVLKVNAVFGTLCPEINNRLGSPLCQQDVVFKLLRHVLGHCHVQRNGVDAHLNMVTVHNGNVGACAQLF
jgi:hypothetical protein